MLRFHFKLVVGFFAGLLLLAYALPYMHQVATRWEGLLAKCIPVLLQQTRDEDGILAKDCPCMPVDAPSVPHEGERILGEWGEFLMPKVSSAKLSESFWARPPPASIPPTVSA